nr:efflux RND transporter periplasmic adaptor subunit [Citreimonas salinaria]
MAEARAGIPAAEARLVEARARVPEAEARLREAETRVPASEAARREAEARVPASEAALAEAEARRPEAEARLAEAEARLREAEINLNAAQRLSEDGFSSQVRLAGAEAAFEAAKAQVQTAKAGVKGAEAAIEAAKGQIEAARAAVESANSQIESARAGVQAARSQLENARAGIETATSQIEGAKAGEQSALSRIEGARAEVETARAQLQSAEAAIESARSAEENALAGIESARAAVASAERQIERLSIVAPFAGLLESDTAEMGALMQPGAACATVLQLDPIKIVGFVPEQDVARLDRGAPATARLTGGASVSGEVTFVSRSADPVTRTFRLELTVDNPDLAIRDGQTAEIGIEADGALAHLLPQSTLTLDDDGTLGVRTVAENDTALFQPVTLLRDTQTGVLVAGLPAQVDVITLGQEYVTDGVPVAPSFEEVIQ